MQLPYCAGQFIAQKNVACLAGMLKLLGIFSRINQTKSLKIFSNVPLASKKSTG